MARSGAGTEEGRRRGRVRRRGGAQARQGARPRARHRLRGGAGGRPRLHGADNALGRVPGPPTGYRARTAATVSRRVCRASWWGIQWSSLRALEMSISTGRRTVSIQAASSGRNGSSATASAAAPTASWGSARVPTERVGDVGDGHLPRPGKVVNARTLPRRSPLRRGPWRRRRGGRAGREPRGRAAPAAAPAPCPAPIEAGRGSAGRPRAGESGRAAGSPRAPRQCKGERRRRRCGALQRVGQLRLDLRLAGGVGMAAVPRTSRSSVSSSGRSRRKP